MSNPLQKYPGESTVFDINCSAVLTASETITGTPILAAVPELAGADGLTFGAPVVNTSSVTYDDGTSAAIGKVVQVNISGGTALAYPAVREYSVVATFSTSAGATKQARATLQVLSLDPAAYA